MSISSTTALQDIVLNGRTLCTAQTKHILRKCKQNKYFKLCFLKLLRSVGYDIRRSGPAPAGQPFGLSPFVRTLEILDNRQDRFKTYVDLCKFLTADLYDTSVLISKAFSPKNALTLDEARITSCFLRYIKDGEHLLEELVTCFDNNAQIARAKNFTSASFAPTHGYGQYALWTNRILEDQGLSLFEKIYTHNFRKEAFSFFYNHLYEQLICLDIKPPRLDYLLPASSKFQAAYFEKVSQFKCGMRYYINRVFEVSLGLYSIGIHDIPINPDLRYDYRCDSQYSTKRESIVAALQRLRPGKNPRIYLEYLEEKINELPKQLTHCDLKFDNLSADNTVFDWDEWGIYPIGYDIAKGIYKYRLTSDTFLLDNLIEEKCKSCIKQDEWIAFNASIKYFVFSFYSSGVCGGEFDLILNRLLKEVECLLTV
jgi:hypothetical protein